MPVVALYEPLLIWKVDIGLTRHWLSPKKVLARHYGMAINGEIRFELNISITRTNNQKQLSRSPSTRRLMQGILMALCYDLYEMWPVSYPISSDLTDVITYSSSYDNWKLTFHYSALVAYGTEVLLHGFWGYLACKFAFVLNDKGDSNVSNKEGWAKAAPQVNACGQIELLSTPSPFMPSRLDQVLAATFALLLGL